MGEGREENKGVEKGIKGTRRYGKRWNGSLFIVCGAGMKLPRPDFTVNLKAG